MVLPKRFCLCGFENEADRRAVLGNDVEGEPLLVGLTNKHLIVRVPAMQDEAALRLDVLDDGMNRKGKQEKAVRVSLSRSLLAVQPIVFEA